MWRALRSIDTAQKSKSVVLHTKSGSLFSYQQQRCIKTVKNKTVRVILLTDLPNAAGFAGDVHDVKPGYARNHLIPLKKALYATPTNFLRTDISDPALTTATTIVRLEDKVEERYEKEAEILRRYLKNKILKIWRNVNAMGDVYPGMVDSSTIMKKLSKQLKIDLDPSNDERVQIRKKPLDNGFKELLKNDDAVEDMLTNGFQEEEKEEEDVPIRELGDFVAKIHLNGGKAVLLKFSVLKR